MKCELILYDRDPLLMDFLKDFEREPDVGYHIVNIERWESVGGNYYNEMHLVDLSISADNIQVINYFMTRIREGDIYNDCKS